MAAWQGGTCPLCPTLCPELTATGAAPGRGQSTGGALSLPSHCTACLGSPQAQPPSRGPGEDQLHPAMLMPAVPTSCMPPSPFPSCSIRQLKERVANLRVKHEQIYNFPLQHIEPQVNWSTVIEEKQVQGPPVPLPGL